MLPLSDIQGIVFPLLASILVLIFCVKKNIGKLQIIYGHNIYLCRTTIVV
jgi:hypothetical protein